MPRDVQIAGAIGPAPQSYTVPNATEIIPRAINATVNGAGAASAFVPTVEIISDGGVVVARIPTDTTVLAGGSAEVSWFPRVRKLTKTVTGSYAAAVTALKGTYTCVAEWHLTEGATPYADTSGFAPADPATMVRQAGVVPMTQGFTPSPLPPSQSVRAVAFNFDGTAVTSSGDYLKAIDTTPSRYQFAGVAPFTVVAWVAPFVGVNAHDGPVVDTIHVTGFGTPGANDNGWRINVTSPGRIPQLQRAATVLSPNTYDTAAGTILPTTAYTMLVGTYDGANLRLYQNGSLVATTASAGNITSTAANAAIGQGPHYLGDFGTWYFGAVGEVTVWAATFTPADVATLYAAAF